MKEFVSTEQNIGGDGGKVKAAIGIEGEDFKVKAEISYPAQKVIEPATKAFDNVLDKIKKAIPGTWDDAMIDKFKAEYKMELIKYMNE